MVGSANPPGRARTCGGGEVEDSVPGVSEGDLAGLVQHSC